MKIRSLALAVAITIMGAGAAIAAEECCCCKDGKKMECCDKMKGAKDAPAQSRDQKPAQPDHQHHH